MIPCWRNVSPSFNNENSTHAASCVVDRRLQYLQPDRGGELLRHRWKPEAPLFSTFVWAWGPRITQLLCCLLSMPKTLPAPSTPPLGLPKSRHGHPHLGVPWRIVSQVLSGRRARTCVNRLSSHIRSCAGTAVTHTEQIPTPSTRFYCNRTAMSLEVGIARSSGGGACRAQHCLPLFFAVVP